MSTDFGWIIAHFDPDNGETDSYLSQEQVYSESYNGAKRTLYGTKYTSVANVKITVIKQDGSDFTLQECRDAYRWLTGNPEASWMDLYIGDEAKYRLLCTIQDVKPQKVDARTVGLNIYCESLSPWAYSPLQEKIHSIPDDGSNIVIDCPSDDMYTYVYAKTIYQNGSADSVKIQNTTVGETTEVSNLAAEEVVTLDSNMIITSNKTSKVFGNSFNFIWPRFKSGANELVVTGDGTIKFEYYYAIKMGDCATNINVVRDPICSEDGTIQVDMLPWERISNTPTTMSGYGISSDVASKYYNKTEVDHMISSLESSGSKEITWAAIKNKPTTISGYGITNAYTKQETDSKINNIYTKSEIDNKFANLDIPDTVELSWDNITGKPTTIGGYGITDTYTKSDVYTKTEVDERLKNISVPGDGPQVSSLSWYKIVDTPTSLVGYGIADAYTKVEIDDMFSSATIDVDEDELNSMLAEVLA